MAGKSDKIKANEHVLFYYNRTKKWLVKITKNAKLHTHIGIISHADAIGKEYGSRLTTNKDKYVYLLRPTTYDYTMKLQHSTQIVYPKESGYMASRMGIQSGQTIVEIGTGSGALTTFLASIVKPRGRVHTFDVDADFMAIAEKNIARAGMTKYVIMNKMDIRKSRTVPVADADAAVIDLGDPWTALPQVRRMLKGSAPMVAVCPTMNQLEKLVSELVANEFTDIECSEQILRQIEAREGKTRHSFQGIGHTAYLCFARKAYFGTKRRRTAKDPD
ncbi:L-isoaspartate methyltransferase/tRNA (1-methyladenosine) methyltransferase [Cenarchaeum symbiosum A]|uniref:L-isoaspartate methyltransferase/tRNA (1-methyladenosine) methyltransferase n=1 Tax=Cenarchaeum symbiosum (strain A) TaxID=414004 RepID=A0RUG5_CENSY|nr:L-isoaspartate methyltransferase/tRNA (1-methyladenosine) methyltransferase [Cenarchaeum symbiosum A]